MPLKVGPPRTTQCGSCGRCSACCPGPAQTFWPRIPEPIKDPCKDACGAWCKFRVRVQKGCPVCVTFLNVGDTPVQVWRKFYINGCDIYKPMGTAVGITSGDPDCPIRIIDGCLHFKEESCDLFINKPGVYEFRNKDGGSFPKDFEWETTELTPHDVSNILTAGSPYVTLQ